MLNDEYLDGSLLINDDDDSDMEDMGCIASEEIMV